MNKGEKPGNPYISEPLVKYLVNSGVGARRSSAALIMAGRVLVNGQKAQSLMLPVHKSDKVTVDGASISQSKVNRELAYLVLNKPPGYVTSARDEHGRKTVMDLVPRGLKIPGLVPAGRLDMDSTGLLIFTNDGDLVYRLTHPRYEVEREYNIVVDRVLQREESRKLLEGMMIDGALAKIISLRNLPPSTYQSREQSRYSAILKEGRNREVRRLFESVGRSVVALRRVRMGSVHLGSLPSGKIRPLSAQELQELRNLVGLKTASTVRRRVVKAPGKNERAKLNNTLKSSKGISK